MGLIEALVADKLKRLNPTLDLSGSDREMLRTACRDLAAFLKAYWNINGDYEACLRLEQLSWREPDEVESFLNLWSKAWLRKWKERVKLVIGEDERWRRIAKVHERAEPLWRSLPNRHEVVDVVARTLVKNGEICGVYAVAESIVKGELAAEANAHLTREKLLRIVGRALRRARLLSRSQGPLLFVKLDRNYFRA